MHDPNSAQTEISRHPAQYSNLRPDYHYISGPNASTTRTGFIAQEVKEIVPELVTIENTKSDINPEGLEDLHTMKYQNTVGLLIEAIKELKSEIEELKKLGAQEKIGKKTDLVGKNLIFN